MFVIENKHSKIVSGSLIGLVIIGILMRLYHITQNDFFLYDEGFYLNYNHLLVRLMTSHPPENFHDWMQAILVWFRFSMASGKALWFLLIDARVFLGLMHAYFIPRLVSAMAGSLTLWITFVFARRFFNSFWLGMLSLVFLAFLPSHMSYSRLGFQEALSTLFFLLGFYFYLFPRSFTFKTFVSGLFFGCAYFTNYRLIILPLLVFVCEFFVSLSEGRHPGFRKYLWHTLTFLSLVFIVGGLDKGENTIVTFSWMFHQTHLASEQFDWFNLLSYPYYLFRLESPFFGILFWGNIYCALRREWFKIFPFVMVCVQMLIFSFAAEKGARYLCVMTPFMAMAAASFVISLFERKQQPALQAALVVFLVVTLGSLLIKSFQIVTSHSDYKPAMEYLKNIDGEAQVLSTQPWIQNLYMDQHKGIVLGCPNRFQSRLALYGHGFRYMVLCPQAYISWTTDGKRFTRHLENYLGFVASHVKPMQVFPHLNRVMLERFVFEHNENLKRSIDFLNLRDQNPGEIKIYEVKSCISAILQWLSYQKAGQEQ